MISIAQLSGHVVVLDFWNPEDAFCQGKRLQAE
jgi:hypothetical protein